MSQVKINFLNWRPDDEDLGNDGLITADNVYHDTEGYKQYKTPTTGAFSTNAGLGTCASVVFRTVGTSNQRIGCFLHNATAAGVGYTIDMSIGLFAENYSLSGLYTTISSSTLTNKHTLNSVSAFEGFEYADLIFITAEAQCATATVINAAAPVITLNSTGYVSI